MLITTGNSYHEKQIPIIITHRYGKVQIMLITAGNSYHKIQMTIITTGNTYHEIEMTIIITYNYNYLEVW